MLSGEKIYFKYLENYFFYFFFFTTTSKCRLLQIHFVRVITVCTLYATFFFFLHKCFTQSVVYLLHIYVFVDSKNMKMSVGIIPILCARNNAFRLVDFNVGIYLNCFLMTRGTSVIVLEDLLTLVIFSS